MRANRLLRLARRLIRVEPKHFNINRWYHNPEMQTPKKVSKNLCLLDEGFCGSTACVLGTAALIPEFKRLGLKIQFLDDTFVHGDIVYKKRGGCETLSQAGAGAAFFGIPIAHAEFLFYTRYDMGSQQVFYTGDDCASTEITPQQVAIRLIEYVETKGKNVENFIHGVK